MTHPFRDEHLPVQPGAVRPDGSIAAPDVVATPTPASQEQADWRAGTATQPGGLPPLAAGGEINAGDLTEIDADEARHPV